MKIPKGRKKDLAGIAAKIVSKRDPRADPFDDTVSMEASRFGIFLNLAKDNPFKRYLIYPNLFNYKARKFRCWIL